MAVSRDETVVEFNHYTRGYHDYMDVWTPTIGETLFLHCEPDNPKDSLAVAIVTGKDVIVGHVPELFNRQLFSTFFNEIAITATVKSPVRN